LFPREREREREREEEIVKPIRQFSQAVPWEKISHKSSHLLVNLFRAFRVLEVHTLLRPKANERESERERERERERESGASSRIGKEEEG
jgi:hypothetical protein